MKLMPKMVRAFAAALLLAFCTGSILAGSVVDPAGDFLPTFTGPRNGDLDVLTAAVTLDGSEFDFTATLNGDVDTTPGVVYVFGVNRGMGTLKFANIGNPGVIFDSTFVINPAGASTVKDLISQTTTTVTDISLSGASISGVVPLSDLPSEGFSSSAYQYNLWPTFVPGNIANSGIADFAPDNSTAAVSSTPEPGTPSLISVAAVLIALATFRRRKEVN